MIEPCDELRGLTMGRRSPNRPVRHSMPRSLQPEPHSFRLSYPGPFPPSISPFNSPLLQVPHADPPEPKRAHRRYRPKYDHTSWSPDRQVPLILDRLVPSRWGHISAYRQHGSLFLDNSSCRAAPVAIETLRRRGEAHCLKPWDMMGYDSGGYAVRGLGMLWTV